MSLCVAHEVESFVCVGNRRIGRWRGDIELGRLAGSASERRGRQYAGSERRRMQAAVVSRQARRAGWGYGNGIDKNSGP